MQTATPHAPKIRLLPTLNRLGLAAHRAGLPPWLAHRAFHSMRRCQALLAHSPCDRPCLMEPFGPVLLEPLDTAQGFVDNFARVAEALDAAFPWNLAASYMAMARMRLERMLSTGDRRYFPRQMVTEEGILAVEGSTYPVNLLDRSPDGIGLSSPVPVPPHRLARVIRKPEGETVVHECLVAHCRPDPEAGFGVGLEVFGTVADED